MPLKRDWKSKCNYCERPTRYLAVLQFLKYALYSACHYHKKRLTKDHRDMEIMSTVEYELEMDHLELLMEQLEIERTEKKLEL